MAQMHGKKLVDSPKEIHVSDMWRFSHEEDDDHQAKKSVLAKVRSKAKKWKHALAKKKHGQDESHSPSWEDSLYEEEEDNVPEYHGAPMYESELAPIAYKEPLMLQTSMAKQFVPASDLRCKSIVLSRGENRIFKTPSEIRALTKSVSDKGVARSRDDLGGSSSSGNARTVVKTLGEMLAPGYTAASEATQMMDSQIQQRSTTPGAPPDGEKHVWDKGVSVKNYLKQKLEPGEEEKALSQVISEAINDRAEEETGVVNKVKEAVSSLLGREEPSSASTIIAVSKITIPNSCIPVSTNPQPDLVEEPHERILQMN